MSDILNSADIAASSRNVRDTIRDKSVALTKSKPTSTVLDLSSKLGERLKSKLNDKMSSSAKSITSANKTIDLSLKGLTDKIGIAGAAEQLVQNAKSSIVNKAESLVKANTEAAKSMLVSKASGMLGGMLQLGGGESSLNEKLADTIATTGPKDDLITKDAYDLSLDIESVFSGFKGKLSDIASEIGNSFRGGGGLASTVASLLIKSDGKIGLDTNALKNRIISAVGGKQGLVNSLSKGLQDGIISGLGLDPSISNRVNVVVDGVLRGIQTDDIKSARGLFNLVGQVVGDNGLIDVIDMGARGQIISQIYKEAIALGVPEAIEIVIDRVGNDPNDNSAIYGLTYSITDAVSRADLKTIDLMIDKLGANAILAAQPDAIAIILATYKFPSGTVDSDYTQLWIELDTLLSRIDSRWYERKRGESWIIDLNVFTNASPDALTLAMLQPDLKIAVMIADEYRYVSLVDLSSRMFPYAVF